jgi:hypothetical protein
LEIRAYLVCKLRDEQRERTADLTVQDAPSRPRAETHPSQPEGTIHHGGCRSAITDDDDGVIAKKRFQSIDELPIERLDFIRQVLVGNVVGGRADADEPMWTIMPDRRPFQARIEIGRENSRNLALMENLS